MVQKPKNEARPKFSGSYLKKRVFWNVKGDVRRVLPVLGLSGMVYTVAICNVDNS